MPWRPGHSRHARASDRANLASTPAREAGRTRSPRGAERTTAGVDRPFAAIAAFAIAPACSAELCNVVSITDGDTLQARCGDQTIKVRIAEIDAPERGQPFGSRARQRLAQLCFGKGAEIEPVDTDRYERTVARVKCDDGSRRACLAVRPALAVGWAARTAGQARADRLGLWADAAAVAPWEWRRAAPGARGAVGSLTPERPVPAW